MHHFFQQSLNYEPEISHDGKKLHCIYEQRDAEGNILFEGNEDDQDEVAISVRFLESAQADVLEMPVAQVRVDSRIM